MKKIHFAGDVQQENEVSSSSSSTMEASSTQHVCASDLTHPAPQHELRDSQAGPGMSASTLTTAMRIGSLTGRMSSWSTLTSVQRRALPGSSDRENSNPTMRSMGARRLSRTMAMSSTKLPPVLSTSSAAMYTNGSMSTTASEKASFQLVSSEMQQQPTNTSATEFSSHVPASTRTVFCSTSSDITTEESPVFDSIAIQVARNMGHLRGTSTDRRGTPVNQSSMPMIVYAGGGQQATLDTHGKGDCGLLLGGASASMDTVREESFSARQLVTLPLSSNNRRLGNPARFSANLAALSLPPRDQTRSSMPHRLTEPEATATTSGLRYRTLGAAATSGIERGAEQLPSDWVVMSAAQAAQATRMLELETERNEALESTVRKQRRDRVVIYDAAMKQAAKREEVYLSEAKQILQREQSTMRAEVDKEMGKVQELYEERCRDYGQMVSDECEGAVSKKVDDLRKDWARQKKTIAQLVKEGDGEDREVTVIVRAVMEQLGEEKKEETEAIREGIYAEIRAEFEARFEAMQDTLKSEHQLDLDGQLLLAEIEHQKDLGRLETELTRGAVGENCGDAATVSIVPFQSERTRRKGGADRGAAFGLNAYPCTPSPSISRRVGVLEGREVSLGRVGVGGHERCASGIGRRGLVGKLPAFKLPSRKDSHGDDSNEHDDGKNKTARDTKKSPKDTASKPHCQPHARMKGASRLFSTAGRKRSAKGNESSAAVQDALNSKGDETSKNVEEGITSALMVSPTKSVAGIATVTPSVVDAAIAKPSRPKKKGKKLFAPDSYY